MRFLFISRRGASLSLATRIVSEGHKVNFFVNNLNYKLLGNGIVEKTKIGEAYNCDVAIFDETGMGEYASKMSKGKPVLGSSVFSDTFNDNLEYKKEVLKRCDLKLSNNGGEKIYITGWYNGFSFITPYHSYFKKTKFIERDLGIETECAGCLLFYHKTNKIVKETLYKLRNELKKIGYRGAITFTCSLTENELSINDVRFGFEFDSTYAALEGLRQDLGEFLYGMTIGSVKRIKASGDWLASTRISIPPYPFKMQDGFKEDTIIGGISSENLRHIWLRDIQFNDGVYKSANCDGYLGSVTARGLTIRKAFRRTLRTIDNLKINNLQYRGDVEIGLEERYNLIKGWGWLN